MRDLSAFRMGVALVLTFTEDAMELDSSTWQTIKLQAGQGQRAGKVSLWRWRAGALPFLDVP